MFVKIHLVRQNLVTKSSDETSKKKRKKEEDSGHFGP